MRIHADPDPDPDPKPWFRMNKGFGDSDPRIRTIETDHDPTLFFCAQDTKIQKGLVRIPFWLYSSHFNWGARLGSFDAIPLNYVLTYVILV
jgi:hypothetical protein